MKDLFDRRIKEASNAGLLLAATLVLVAVYVLTGERRSYSHTFDLSSLPLILGERIKGMQGIEQGQRIMPQYLTFLLFVFMVIQQPSNYATKQAGDTGLPISR